MDFKNFNKFLVKAQIQPFRGADVPVRNPVSSDEAKLHFAPVDIPQPTRQVIFTVESPDSCGQSGHVVEPPDRHISESEKQRVNVDIIGLVGEALVGELLRFDEIRIDKIIRKGRAEHSRAEERQFRQDVNQFGLQVVLIVGMDEVVVLVVCQLRPDDASGEEVNVGEIIDNGRTGVVVLIIFGYEKVEDTFGLPRENHDFRDQSHGDNDHVGRVVLAILSDHDVNAGDDDHKQRNQADIEFLNFVPLKHI